jgi:non-homologous end joining protein Ku
MKGRKPAAPKGAPASAPVIDLMAALKRSLQQEVKLDRSAAGDKPKRAAPRQQRQKKRA